MHQPKNYYDRLVIENGQIVRVLTAEWHHKNYPEKEYYCDVYKESDSGKAWSQNLYSNMWGGHCVAFPGLPYNDKSYWYYDPTIAQEEGWCQLGRKSSVGWSNMVTDSDIDFVCQLYPNFKYVAAKYELKSLSELMQKLEYWIEHRELELLLAAGYEKIGMNKNFWRLTEKNRKATITFMRQNPICSNLCLKEVREVMRSDNPALYAEYYARVVSWYRPSKNYSTCAIDVNEFKYLKKNYKKFEVVGDSEEIVWGRMVELYRDYKYMLYRSNHNENDDYWHYPSDLNDFHYRLVEEERIAEEARRIAREKEKVKELKKLSVAMKRIEKKFMELNGTVDGYSIFVTSDYEEWRKQADALHQCIVASGYYQGTAKGDYTIVFIQKEGKPVATAQIHQDGHIGQFYGDEIDRYNCKPSKEVAEAFNKWLETIPKSKFKKAKPRQRKSEKKEVAA